MFKSKLTGHLNLFYEPLLVVLLYSIEFKWQVSCDLNMMETQYYTTILPTGVHKRDLNDKVVLI